MALLEINFFSDVLGMCTSMNVILPDYPSGINSKHPTVYLLHGMSDDHTAWCRYTSIERYARERGIAIVMPETHLGWYTDMYMGNNYWTFLSKELPEICRSFFPGMSALREDTYAAGLSMGGYGALKCAVSAPETFCSVGCLSGALDIVPMAAEWKNENVTLWQDIFGPADQIEGSKNDLISEASRLMKSDLPKPKIFSWCGTEDFLYKNNVETYNNLKALGFDITFEESPGDHQWKYWDEKIQRVFDFFGFTVKEIK